MRTVYMYEKIEVYTVEEQLRDLEIGRAAAKGETVEENDETDTGN